jgi:hypothetical protein
VDDAYWQALAEIDGDTLELVDLLFARPERHSSAACRGQVRLMFPERGDDTSDAHRLCPVAIQCAEAGRN